MKKMLLSPTLLPTAPLLPQRTAASLLSCSGKQLQGEGAAAQKGSETPEFAGDTNLTSFQRTAPSSPRSMQSPGTLQSMEMVQGLDATQPALQASGSGGMKEQICILLQLPQMPPLKQPPPALPWSHPELLRAWLCSSDFVTWKQAIS